MLLLLLGPPLSFTSAGVIVRLILEGGESDGRIVIRGCGGGCGYGVVRCDEGWEGWHRVL
jgi:hypothetical protein